MVIMGTAPIQSSLLLLLLLQPEHYINVKHTNVIRKLVPSALLLYTKWQLKLGDAGAIDRFGLVFQYQILKNK